MDERPVVLVAARERVVRRLVTAALRPAGFSIAESDIDHSLPERASDTHPDVLIVEATEPGRGLRDMAQDLSPVADNRLGVALVGHQSGRPVVPVGPASRYGLPSR
jgi:AmiR/NasT family two-component response regulator